MNKTMRVGIMSRQDYRKRTIAIANGDYVPKSNEPKVWFESMQSMAQVLSNENQELLRLIVEKKPASLKELSDISHRRPSNLSRTLKTLERYGIVKLDRHKRHIVPKVQATQFRVDFGVMPLFKCA